MFNENSTVEMLMKEYIIECIKSYDEVVKKANTPAKNNIFYVKNR